MKYLRISLYLFSVSLSFTTGWLFPVKKLIYSNGTNNLPVYEDGINYLLFWSTLLCCSIFLIRLEIIANKRERENNK